jgi:peptidoglycan/LPS O-acetylase OafA/YrhL
MPLTVDPVLSPRLRSPTSLALDNLRGIVILIVLGFHSALAYVSWVATPETGFDHPPYNWRAFPIVDSNRFFGFDLFCAWQDVYLMALMFFLSGLFVWPSLMRKKNRPFVRDRVLRLGVPFVFGIAVIIPLAVYPAYRVTAAEPGVVAYAHALLALPFWPNGPLWFLWQLLVLNVLAVLAHWLTPGALRTLGRWSGANRVGPYFIVLVAASAVAYIPLALIFSPWHWSNSGLFAVQLSRPLLYAVYFFAGLGVGMAGIDRGLVAAHGPLPQRWALWLTAALASLALWMGLTYLTLNGRAPIGVRMASDFSYTLACAAGTFFVIAACLRFAAGPSRILGSLGRGAYPLYLLHYVFVVWLQFALLGTPLVAEAKAAIVFGGTLVCSWISLVALTHFPLGARLTGSAQRPVAAFAAQTPQGFLQRSHEGAVRPT